MNRYATETSIENSRSAVKSDASPKQIVRPIDAVGLIVGIVIGAGIFSLPSNVAGAAATTSAVYLAWILGGGISLLGAIVYAELATTYPNTGGDYYFLTRAFGGRFAFLFGWARMTVIQTGSIATVSYIFGDYASRLLSLGPYSSAIYAAVVVVILSALNIIGVREGTRTQNLLSGIEVLGVVLVIAAAFFAGPAEPATQAVTNTGSIYGLMLLFVLFTYGGWNEAAYVSGELRDVQRNMARVLIASILLITTLYVLVNWAYLYALGLGGTAASRGVAADLMQRAFGPAGAALISVMVAVSALSTANATVFTGGRSSYAFGRDFKQFGFLGRWSAQTGTPVNGLIVQAAITLGLVVWGMFTRQAFETIIGYTAPVFWFFFMMTGIAFFVLRQKDPGRNRPFRVPLYPIPPIVFTLTCAYLLYSSLDFIRLGALVGVGVLAVGALLLLFFNPSMSDTKQ
jgi:basic amino acid/polyamine antiporter, APA family